VVAASGIGEAPLPELPVPHDAATLTAKQDATRRETMRMRTSDQLHTVQPAAARPH
jgi:hypothetical protein